ncbi:MAG: outer membrane protein assembly factor BamE [Rickettsiales bacterium]
MNLYRKTKLFLAVLLIVTGCTIKVANHGYVFEKTSLEKLKENKTTKAEVLEIMGTPSVISSFDKNIWYYIHTQTKQISMLKPKNINENILQISFKKNVINSLNIYEDDKIKSLNFEKEESPIRGDDTGVLKDFMQNLGRFNKSRVKR